MLIYTLPIAFSFPFPPTPHKQQLDVNIIAKEKLAAIKILTFTLENAMQ